MCRRIVPCGRWTSTWRLVRRSVRSLSGNEELHSSWGDQSACSRGETALRSCLTSESTYLYIFAALDRRGSR